MKTLLNKKPNGPAIWMFLAAILILVYIGLMIVLFLSHLKIVYEHPLLLPIMNTIFAALIPIAVSIIAASVIARNEAISSCHEIASVAAFLILMIFLNARESSAVFESPILLALLNTVFLYVIPLVMAYIAAKNHHATGVFAMLP